MSDLKARGGVLTQHRFSTATKTVKSAKKLTLCGKSGSVADSQTQYRNVNTCSNRHGSTKMTATQMRQRSDINAYSEEGGDDFVSDRSGKTHVLDEVLHQQKTDAYRELERRKCNSVVSQNTIVCQNAAKNMGRIVEQEDDQDVSLDRGDIAQEL